MRPPLALLAGLAVAVVAAAVLGEYAFDGWAVVGSGVLTGLFVAEAVVTVARRGGRIMAIVAGALAAGALLAAGWVSTDHRPGTVGWKGWAAVVVAALAAGFRARPTGAARHSRPAPAAAE